MVLTRSARLYTCPAKQLVTLKIECSWPYALVTMNVARCVELEALKLATRFLEMTGTPQRSLVCFDCSFGERANPPRRWSSTY